MIPLLDQQRAMADAQEAFNHMRLYKGTEQYKSVVEWIESIIVQQQTGMINCGKDKLADAQVRLKQLISLRSALQDPGGAFTGYTFD